MKISCVQFDVRIAREMGAYVYCEKMIREAAREKPDVILLPERWNAFGRPETHRDQADRNGAMTRLYIGALAAELKTHIVAGSVAELRGEKLYNTAYVFNRAGETICRYDKAHLYQDAIERDFYEAGDSMGLFELDGISCGVVICYDLNFPEWIRCYGLKGVDVLFAPLAWPAAHLDHLALVQRSRALETQCCLAAAGLCKSDAKGHYKSGGTAIVSPDASFLIQGRSRAGIYTGEVDRKFIEEVRKWQHFLRDRRGDLYRKFGI